MKTSGEMPRNGRIRAEMNRNKLAVLATNEEAKTRVNGGSLSQAENTK